MDLTCLNLILLCLCEGSHFQSLSHIQLFATPQTVAHQTPLSMEFSRQEYCSGLPFPTPGDLPNAGIKPHLLCLLHWQANSLPKTKTKTKQTRNTASTSQSITISRQGC